MKPALLLGFVLVVAYSCKKEVTDYDKVVGDWMWTKTTYRFNYESQGGQVDPLPPISDSVFFRV